MEASIPPRATSSLCGEPMPSLAVPTLNDTSDQSRKRLGPKQRNDLWQLQQQQKRLDKTFYEDKKRILESLVTTQGCDNSPKGFVDPACFPIMQRLNDHPDYVTTSSCSGRIALFHSLSSEGDEVGGVGVKRGSLKARGWVYVTHDLIADRERDEVVQSMLTMPSTPEEDLQRSSKASAVDGLQAHVGESTTFVPPGYGELSLKCEPFVMHIQCRTMESAKALMSAAVSDAGFRNSGVVPPGARIMVAIRHAGLSLDVPLILGGINVCLGPAGQAYLTGLLGLCNAKLKENFRRIEILDGAIAKRIPPCPLTTSASA
jgi:tRNA wybutosine-synthesizing protein 3